MFFLFPKRIYIILEILKITFKLSKQGKHACMGRSTEDLIGLQKYLCEERWWEWVRLFSPVDKGMSNWLLCHLVVRFLGWPRVFDVCLAYGWKVKLVKVKQKPQFPTDWSQISLLPLLINSIPMGTPEVVCYCTPSSTLSVKLIQSSLAKSQPWIFYFYFFLDSLSVPIIYCPYASCSAGEAFPTWVISVHIQRYHNITHWHISMVLLWWLYSLHTFITVSNLMEN